MTEQIGIEIPDAAVEPVAKHAGVHPDDARLMLEAALPHLRAAILADLRAELEAAVAELENPCADDESTTAMGIRFVKAEGVKVALSHIDDTERAEQ